MTTTLITFKFLSSSPKLFSPKRFFCNSSHHQQQSIIQLEKYKETFSQRMAMAGLKPHHRIAMGVSGGPDSVALCVLAAGWKSDAQIGKDESNGCIDGLLAIIVDHNLRVESKDEAETVRNRISSIGVNCHIACCDWSDGRPKQGHLQEMARDMRYQIFQRVCREKQIGVLLIAQHADDQAELFILRLSRNSGVLGLAGMAFTSQLFPTNDHCGGSLCSHGILLVRPLLEFSKEDLYRICQGSKQEWVEDPTNQSPLFARNRIRMSLRNLSSSTMKSEVQAIISECRKTRSYVDKICSELSRKAVTITDHGYAIIDLEKLDPLKINDVCLSKFSASLLQFISQRHRQVRGKTLKLVLGYIQNLPCKTSFTAAGCYLCPAPQSKGTKILVCYSPHTSHSESSKNYPFDEKMESTLKEMEKIIKDGISYSESFIPGTLDVPFLHMTSSDSVLTEGKRLNIISESTYNDILLLQKEETKNFEMKTEVTIEKKTREIVSIPEQVQSGQYCHFTNRFLVTWKLHIKKDAPLVCNSCIVGNETVGFVRHMVDKDWLYLGDLSRGLIYKECKEKTLSCSDYVRVSAEKALQALKYIPLAARRSLPVLVNSDGLLLSIPSIGFEHCPCMLASGVFKPRVPLGGGHTSFI
ncbi:tRNA(Ile)-lysidine synthetase [Ranunculus cassubicifolius]